MARPLQVKSWGKGFPFHSADNTLGSHSQGSGWKASSREVTGEDKVKLQRAHKKGRANQMDITLCVGHRKPERETRKCTKLYHAYVQLP